MSDLVYKEFNKNINVVKPFNVPKDWFDVISIDVGLVNPFSVHWYAKDSNGNIYVIAEHYKGQEPLQYHYEFIKKISKRLGWKDKTLLCEPSVNQRSLYLSKSVANMLYDYGFMTIIAPNDVFKGIQSVKQKLAEGKIFIFDCCKHLIDEIKKYSYSDGGIIPIKQKDHAMDDLRRYVLYQENKQGELK